MSTARKTGVCNECYTWGKICRGLCPKCYYRQWYYARTNGVRGVKATHCKNCNIDLKLTSHVVVNMCKKCYEISRKRNHSCEGCGAGFPRGSAYKLCKLCRDAQKNIQVESKLLRDVYVSPEIKTLIKVLLVKFRMGLWGAIDVFRVAHLYLTLFEYEVSFEVMDEFTQAKIMLKRLEKLL